MDVKGCRTHELLTIFFKECVMAPSNDFSTELKQPYHREIGPFKGLEET